MRDLTGHLRQLIVVQTLGEPPDSFSVTADQVPRLEAQARDLSQAEAVRAIDLLADAIAAVKEGADPRTQLELALLKAARPRADASIEALLTRIERLEQGAPDGGAPGRDPPDEPRAPTRAPTEPAAAAPRRSPARRRRRPRSSGDVELNALWPAVLERVREAEGGEMLAALLAEARPVALEEDVLVLVVSRRPPRSASARSRTAPTASASAEALRAGRRAARSACGSSSSDGASSQDAGTPPERLTEDEVIDALQERRSTPRTSSDADHRGKLTPDGARCPSPT